MKQKVHNWWCTIMLVLMVIGFGKVAHDINILKKGTTINQPKYSYAYDCIKEAELEYYNYKYLLTTEVQNYINSVAPASNLRAYAVVEECDNYNIDIKFVLAQAEIESHFGTKGIGAKLNNVFNIGVFDNLSTEEISKNYKYNYPNESIEPYLKLLTNNYLVNKLEGDLMQNYVDINGNRYATDKHYESKLKDKYNSICSSTKIDEYYDLMKSYAIKCNR